MRNNFIMHFCCSECGSVLNIRTESEETVKSEKISSLNSVPREPTGGTLRSIPPIQIEPCRKCIEKYTGPAKLLASAIKDLSVL